MQWKNNPKNNTSFVLYFIVSAAALILYELTLATQFGSIDASRLFFLFFIPSEALILTALCGIGNKLSSLITFPIVLLLPAVYYIAQTVYLTNAGTMFSVSMMGLGTTAVGDFGWAMSDTIIRSIPRMAILLLPALSATLLISIRPLRQAIYEKSRGKIEILPYSYLIRLCVIAAGIILWFAAVGGIKLFGEDRPSPYYLYKSSSATTDAAAHKLGVLTTAVVETRSYFGGETEQEQVVFELEEDSVTARNITEDDGTYVIHVSETPDEAVENENIPKAVPQINEKLDFKKVSQMAEDETVKSLADFIANRKPSTTNEYTGMFEGYNLIYICAESFWNYACNEKITPTLYMMANNGIVLNNYYNSFYNTTTNGEYAFSTGLWPDVSRNSKNGTDVGSFAQSASKFMPQGMGDLFGENGIPSYGFHNYYGKYYRRVLSWPNLGYKCRFTGDGMWFTSNWPASDLELMQQTVDDYINEDRFNVYYMTFSGHGPFSSKNYMFNKNIDEVTRVLGEEEYNIDARGYFCGELEFDKAMEYLLKRLNEAGKADNTVIVIAADHYPYYLSEEGFASLTKNDDLDTNFDIYKSSCIIYNAGMKEPLYVDDYCSNVDIPPTVLNLFNIPYESRLMMGRDIFSSEAHKRATLYNMSFITDKVRYNYETGEATWSDTAANLSNEEKDKYINSQLANIENEYTASCKMISSNFFLNAYKICGLLSEAEIKAELARESEVLKQDEDMNAEDEAEKLEKEMQKQQELMEQEAQEMQQMQNDLMQQLLMPTDNTDRGATVDNAGDAAVDNANDGAATDNTNGDVTIENTVDTQGVVDTGTIE